MNRFQSLSIPMIAACSALIAAAAAAQTKRPDVVDDATRQELVARIAELLEERYIFPDKAKECSALMKRRLDAGEYDEVTVPERFADTLTRDLRSVTHDRHLRVNTRRQLPPPPPAGLAPEDVERRRRRQAARRNFGFQKLERLQGNVGYLDLRGFMPASAAGDKAVAAMAFLADSDAVIIDLRKNGGGNPTMIQLISSYFFEEPTHLNSFEWRGQEGLKQFWTLPHVDGKKMVDVPLYVLTSQQTFSAAEEFTYNLKNLERATIVGETTGGGAHPGGQVPINDFWAVWIPQGRAVNPITGTNWEGTGVTPHIEAPAEGALLVAHREALKTLAENEDDDEQAAMLRWAITELDARIHPVEVSAAWLEKLAGAYGPRRVSYEDGALWYQREGRARHRLRALTKTVFQPEGLDFFRIRFEEKDGRVARLVGLYDDGREDVSPRDDT